MPRSLPDHWFFATGTKEDVHAFEAEEARHASKALRLSLGDELQWLDGKGGRYEGQLTKIDRSGMWARVTSQHREAPPQHIGLYVGQLHDATRLEWLVEKATELGSAEITLLATARVQRTRYRMERLRAKALAALKQSGRGYLPQISELDLEAAFAKTNHDAMAGDTLRLIAHCYAALPRTPLSDITVGQRSVELFIGPEGDFTPEEIVLAKAHHCQSVSLGEARLRTETAAVAALAVLALR